MEKSRGSYHRSARLGARLAEDEIAADVQHDDREN
jgi:hypothetical protein